MENNIKFFLLVFICLLLPPAVGETSPLIQDAVIKIVTTTDRGDVVTAEADSDQLKKLSVEINGRKISVDVNKYSDLKGPFLHSMKLYVDSSKNNDDYVRRVVIPFFEYKDIKDVSLVLDLGSSSVLKAIVISNIDLDHQIYAYPID